MENAQSTHNFQDGQKWTKSVASKVLVLSNALLKRQIANVAEVTGVRYARKVPANELRNWAEKENAVDRINIFYTSIARHNRPHNLAGHRTDLTGVNGENRNATSSCYASNNRDAHKRLGGGGRYG